MIQEDRYVGFSLDSGRLDQGPRVWHIDPDCSALAGRETQRLTHELQEQIERTHSRLLRPCRMCSK